MQCTRGTVRIGQSGVARQVVAGPANMTTHPNMIELVRDRSIYSALNEPNVSPRWKGFPRLIVAASMKSVLAKFCIA